MASALKLSDIKTRALQWADKTGTDLLVPGFTELVNEALGELYEIIIEGFSHHIEKHANISIVAGTESYTLPTDFYRDTLIWHIDGTDRRIMIAANPEDYQIRQGIIISWQSMIMLASPYKFDIRGGSLYIKPTPQDSFTVEFWYVPELTKFVTDATTITFAIPTNWEDYLPVAVAAKMLIIEESDASAVISERDRIAERIRRSAARRRLGGPGRIRDVRSMQTMRHRWY